MNIVLIVLIFLASLFLLTFILGAIKASSVGSDKKRYARALFFLSQMTKDQITTLKDIYSAYSAGDIKGANRISEQASPGTINFLVNFFDYDNRPIEYSSGKIGRVTWLTFIKQLRKLGCSESVSRIIPVVVMDNYNDVLEKNK